MKTYRRKQLTIICELPLARIIKNVLQKAGVSGYTQFEAASGLGREGLWNREGQLGEAGRMVMFVSVISNETADAVVEAVYQVLEPQMGIVTLADVEVLRPERF